jgi:hypothetical protein
MKFLWIIFSLGTEDANRLLTSTSTTVIRTEARAQGENHVAGAEVVVGQTAKPVESASSKSSSSNSSSSATKTTQ